MPIKVERLADLPCVIAVYEGMIKSQDVEELFDETVKLIPDIQGHYYRINDFRTAESTFADIVQMINTARGGRPGSTTDPNLTAIVVGTNEWGQMMRKYFGQERYGALNIPFVHTLEEAIEWVKNDMA